MRKKIMIAVDSSVHSRNAIAYAIQLSEVISGIIILAAEEGAYDAVVVGRTGLGQSPNIRQGGFLSGPEAVQRRCLGGAVNGKVPRGPRLSGHGKFNVGVKKGSER